jgi:hypothetical protein
MAKRPKVANVYREVLVDRLRSKLVEIAKEDGILQSAVIEKITPQSMLVRKGGRAFKVKVTEVR